MVDPEQKEIDAMIAASGKAGEYIESLGKSDLAAFTEDEFMTLIEVVITGYQESIANAPPF